MSIPTNIDPELLKALRSQPAPDFRRARIAHDHAVQSTAETLRDLANAVNAAADNITMHTPDVSLFLRKFTSVAEEVATLGELRAVLAALEPTEVKA